MREWLRGGAPPCQGGGRGFESRLALFIFFKRLLYSSRFFYLVITKLRFNCERSESHRRALQMRIWEKILCSWACAA